MRFKVYLLRRRGRRLPWQEVKNGPTYTGRLSTHVEQHNGDPYRVLKLEPSDPMSEHRPPALYEPVLLGFAPLAFRLRGFERVEGQDGGYSVVQEWHCETACVGTHVAGSRTASTRTAGCYLALRSASQYRCITPPCTENYTAMIIPYRTRCSTPGPRPIL